jgi:argininosuccinate lyase
LGFDKPALNSLDAVASRDLILRLLAAASILGITLSRLSADLLLWTTEEFGFLSLPDDLVGSSSMMPQKRNPFLLEHIQGRCTGAIGAFAASAAAMHAKPFTNSIAVGTEAVVPIWSALQSTTEAALLSRLIVAGASPNPATMLAAAVKGYTSATELANRLVTEGGMPFRTSHKTVGTIIRAAVEEGNDTLEDAAAQWQAVEHSSISLEGLDPASVVQSSVYGGGPGPTSFMACLQALRSERAMQIRQKNEQEQRWRVAEARLSEATQQL